jgi:hypothetical protein
MIIPNPRRVVPSENVPGPADRDFVGPTRRQTIPGAIKGLFKSAVKALTHRNDKAMRRGGVSCLLLGLTAGTAALANTYYEKNFGQWAANCNDDGEPMTCSVHSMAPAESRNGTYLTLCHLYLCAASKCACRSLRGGQRRLAEYQNLLSVCIAGGTPLLEGQNHWSQVSCRILRGQRCTLNMVISNDMLLYPSGGVVSFALVQGSVTTSYHFDLNDYTPAMRAAGAQASKYLPMDAPRP